MNCRNSFFEEQIANKDDFVLKVQSQRPIILG